MLSQASKALINEEEDFVDELKPGTKLMHGQYTIERFLAAGGFGITYLASDSLGRPVVIKECFPGNFCRRQNCSVQPRSRAHLGEFRSLVRLFAQEAMNLSKAGHPNVVGVHQVFDENNTAYMAIDYVEGHDLLEILNEYPERLSPERVEHYLMKLLDAVGHVHSRGILHRDISPDNIVINLHDEPILIDFGAARENADEKASRMLSALRVVKDGYSPQEFYIAGSAQGPSCDLYSLAASFYHIITGKLPPDSQVRLTACASREPDPYVPLAQQANDYSKRFNAALDKAMSVLPKDRMQSAEDWIAQIRGTAVATPSEHRTSANKEAKTAKEAKKFAVKPLLLGCTAIATAAGVGFFYFAGPNVSVGTAPDVTRPVASATPTSADTGSDAPIETTSSSPAYANETAIPAATAAKVEPTSPEASEIDVVTNADKLAEGLAAPDTGEAGPKPADGSSTVASLDATSRPPAGTVANTDATEPVLKQASDLAASPTSPAETMNSPSQEDTANSLRVADGPDRILAEGEAAAINLSTTWAVRLPFGPDKSDPTVVGEVLLKGWVWLKEGTKIVTVNGVGIESIESIPAVLRDTVDLKNRSQLEIRFGTGSGEHSIILPVVQTTQVGDGAAFETAFRNGVWFTTVVKTDKRTLTTLKTGDILIEYLSAKAAIDDRTSVADALARDLREGATTFPFLVSRDGEVAKAELSLLPDPDAHDETPVVAEVEAPVPAAALQETAITEEAGSEAEDVAPVAESLKPSLPFTLSQDETGVIDTVLEGAPDWVAEGQRIKAVDGTAVSTNADILGLFDAATGQRMGEADVSLAIAGADGETASERTLTIRNELQTMLLNGLGFTTRSEDGAIVTHVTMAPRSSALRVGDRIVAYVPTGEKLDGHVTIKSIIDRESAAGKSTFNFYLEREGQLWIEALTLAALDQ